jgi:hypothetical protein
MLFDAMLRLFAHIESLAVFCYQLCKLRQFSSGNKWKLLETNYFRNTMNMQDYESTLLLAEYVPAWAARRQAVLIIGYPSLTQNPFEPGLTISHASGIAISAITVDQW